MKRYTIDLDLSPSRRWLEPISDHRAIFPALVKAFERVVDNDLGKTSKACLKFLIERFGRSLKPEWQEELKAISKASGIDFKTLLCMNMGYELDSMSSGCSTAIIFDEQKNEMVHFRTLDWDLPILKDLTIVADFVKNSQVLYTSITWVGFVGVYTAVSNIGYSVSINYRKPDSSCLIRWCNVAYSFCRHLPASFALREALEMEIKNPSVDFSRVHSYLDGIKTISPCYIVISTCTHAHIVVKGIDSQDRSRSSKKYQPMIQTNHDIGHVYKDPSSWASKDALLISSFKRYDQASDVRFQSPDVFMGLFRKPPILNSQTIFTAVLYPMTGEVDIVF